MQKTGQQQYRESETLHGVALDQRLDPKCANPTCPIVFHWLIGGKFFRFSDRHCDLCEHKTNAESYVQKSCGGHCIKHFWLCERCSDVFTLVYQKPEGVVLKLERAELPEAEAEVKASCGSDPVL